MIQCVWTILYKHVWSFLHYIQNRSEYCTTLCLCLLTISSLFNFENFQDTSKLFKRFQEHFNNKHLSVSTSIGIHFVSLNFGKQQCKPFCLKPFLSKVTHLKTAVDKPAQCWEHSIMDGTGWIGRGQWPTAFHPMHLPAITQCPTSYRACWWTRGIS